MALSTITAEANQDVHVNLPVGEALDITGPDDRVNIRMKNVDGTDFRIIVRKGYSVVPSLETGSVPT